MACVFVGTNCAGVPQESADCTRNPERSGHLEVILWRVTFRILKGSILRNPEQIVTVLIPLNII
jgi:hypothetical protein